MNFMLKKPILVKRSRDFVPLRARQVATYNPPAYLYLLKRECGYDRAKGYAWKMRNITVFVMNMSSFVMSFVT